MAKSTQKAKDFFEQRKTAIKTSTIVAAAANKETKDNNKSIIVPNVPPKPEPINKASGKKEAVLSSELPEDLKNFIEQNNFLSGKISTQISIETDNNLQISLLQLKRKYRLNNRQINKTILLSYIVDKALREDELFVHS
ncbi:MAG: hypothetical protein LBS50_09755 [Prevotellaceae bacterium]|jgi:hypothetical protein|nr:hypothetical protein [Prevotellaceae bacterium]